MGYKPVGYTTYSDGWRTPSSGEYKREDGTTFTVPVKEYRDMCTGRITRTYGGYTQAELHEFSEAQRKK